MEEAAERRTKRTSQTIEWFIPGSFGDVFTLRCASHAFLSLALSLSLSSSLSFSTRSLSAAYGVYKCYCCCFCFSFRCSPVGKCPLHTSLLLLIPTSGLAPKTDPYEMGLKIEDRAFAICDCGTPGTYTARKGRFVLYIKKGNEMKETEQHTIIDGAP